MADKPNKAVNIDQLLGQLNSRTEPEADRSATSKAAVRKHWQQTVKRQQRQRRVRFQWAMAASVMLMVTFSLLNMNHQQGPAEPIVWGTLLAASGQVNIQPPGQHWQPWQPAQSIVSGSRIETADDSHLSFRLADNSQIRLAAKTLITTADQSIFLQRGQLYHDTDEALTAAPLIINTSLGEVQHIGTRYLVSKQNNQLTVAVRSGEVSIHPVHQTTPGQRLIENQVMAMTDQGTSNIRPISKHDALWDWTFQAQPAFNLHNKSLHEFIQWYARQTGLQVDWQGLESPSKRVRLQGNIENMNAEQAIQTVFLTTSYRYQIANGKLQISQQKK
ncbi:FecR family protein [Marinicella sediminis]|uniref:FecR family protein n=1 Tax=Marinicella sediminis TaxID=1792834 RepID=A0ABV7J7B7_9GAMM|nr:FecR family protein [Marinicella sediminis]